MLSLPSTILWRFSHMLRISVRWLKVGATYKVHHVCWKLTSVFGFALQGGWWEAPKSTRCRGHVWGPAKFYFLRDSAQKELQTQQSVLLSKLFLHSLSPFPLLFFHVMLTNPLLDLHTQLYFFNSICRLFTDLAQVAVCNTCQKSCYLV
jgi:hypothetical protein